MIISWDDLNFIHETISPLDETITMWDDQKSIQLTFLDIPYLIQFLQQSHELMALGVYIKISEILDTTNTNENKIIIHSCILLCTCQVNHSYSYDSSS